jgi:hypothetical protein
MFSYKQVGVIHFLALGRWRLSICRAKVAKLPRNALPIDLAWPVGSLCSGELLARLYAQKISPERS